MAGVWLCEFVCFQCPCGLLDLRVFVSAMLRIYSAQWKRRNRWREESGERRRGERAVECEVSGVESKVEV